MVAHLQEASAARLGSVSGRQLAELGLDGAGIIVGGGVEREGAGDVGDGSGGGGEGVGGKVAPGLPEKKTEILSCGRGGGGKQLFPLADGTRSERGGSQGLVSG